jgi:SHS2 domain-containing protein
MGHRFIDHTADVAADLDGRSPAELFVSGAQALTDTITALDAVRPLVTQPVTVQAPTIEDLLVDWLNELVYRFEVDNLLVATADLRVDQQDGRWRLSGTIGGERFEPARHPSRVQVKGATYHGLHVTGEHGTWTARVVFDI